MDKVKRARKKALIRAIIFTVLLVAGIPMIPIGFVFAICSGDHVWDNFSSMYSNTSCFQNIPRWR